MADAFTNALKEQFATCISLPPMEYRAELDANGYRFSAIAVISMTVRHNYLTSMFEEMLITVVMKPSHYSQAILHGHENLKMDVIQKAYSGFGKPSVKKYHAVLVSHRDEVLEGNKTNIGEAGAQDQTTFSVVTFQLLSVPMYNLRLREVGGIFENTTSANVIKALLCSMRLSDDYSNSESISKINVDSVASGRIYGTIKIPEGTPLLGMVDYLQYHYGVFPTGIGLFLKDQTWYLFSPFGIQKHEQDVKRLIVFNAPPGLYRSVERNFRVDGKTTTIIATGPTIHSKRSDAEALNEGTAIRMGTLRVVDGGISPTDQKADPKTRPGNYMHEYRSGEYNNPYNNTVTSKTRFTDNPLHESSKLAARGGQLVKVIWENGFTDPLVPGMPVTFLYGQNGSLQQMKGTLVDVEFHSNIPLGGFVEPKHQGTVSLTLFLKYTKNTLE